MVITSTTREFLIALVGAAASLTGLLFVAISVAPRDGTDGGPLVIRQIRAAAALLAFVNCLAVALFGLQLGISIRYPAVVLGVTGIFFTAAATRTILSSPTTVGQRRGQLSLLNLLLLIFGTELVCGIVLLGDSRSQTALDVLCGALVCSLLVGIARAWDWSVTGTWASSPRSDCSPRRHLIRQAQRAILPPVTMTAVALAEPDDFALAGLPFGLMGARRLLAVVQAAGRRGAARSRGGGRTAVGGCGHRGAVLLDP
jgi:hypothetical protein